MPAPTEAQARERARKAKEMFEAVSGHPASSVDSPIDCAQLHISSALYYAEAVSAILADAGEAAISYWEDAAGTFAAAAQKCDERVR